MRDNLYNEDDPDLILKPKMLAIEFLKLCIGM